MAKLISTTLLAFLPLLVVSELANDDVLLNIVTTCPGKHGNRSDIGQIWVITDFPAVVTLNCANGNKTKKNHAEVSVKFFIAMTSEQITDKENSCLLHKFPKYDTYQVEVSVTRRYNPLLYRPTRRYSVICTYDPYARAKTRPLEVKFPVPSFYRIIKDKGKDMKYAIKMEVITLDGKRITGTLPLGLKVQLRGRIKDSYNCAKMTVGRCIAYNEKRSYEILKNGCGDGVVLPQEIGFTTSNKWFYSPIFEAFHLRDSMTIQFECILYTCKTRCRPSSCPNSVVPVTSSDPTTRYEEKTRFKLQTKPIVETTTVETSSKKLNDLSSVGLSKINLR